MFSKKYKYIITNQKKVYDSIEILSAIDEFIYYGKTKSLKRLLYGVVEGQKIEDKRVEVIIGKLEKTADDLQLCRTDSVFEDFYGTNDERGVIDTLEEYLADDENNNDPVDILFRHIAGIIDNEYSALKKYRCENDGKKLLGIIKWCISKEYIQQAVTFCSERIPKALHEMGVFMIKPRFMEYIGGIRGDKNVYELFYDIIANFTGKNPYGQQILKAASYNTIDRILSQNVSFHPRKADYLNSLKNNKKSHDN